VKTDITVNSTYGVSVAGEGGSQTIKITNPGVKPTVVTEKVYEGSGPCSPSNEGKIKNHLAKEIERVFPDKVKTAVNAISFTEASIFALQNLLFGAKDRMNLTKAYVPGDLLVLGALTVT
jgi:hypothetical protein